jgi:SAM-dependent methyltransferase
LPTPDGANLRFPFVELMSEIWRVLRPGGLLYAQTPAVPHESAFIDPTHTNFVTFGTHAYFTKPLLAARPYGFTGAFEMLRLVRFKPRTAYDDVRMSKLSRLRHWFAAPVGPGSHILWEFRAVK